MPKFGPEPSWLTDTSPICAVAEAWAAASPPARIKAAASVAARALSMACPSLSSFMRSPHRAVGQGRGQRNRRGAKTMGLRPRRVQP